ncbi:MAG TPA: hypothetical protein VF486_17565, partial [Actinomycetes bacterium]
MRAARRPGRPNGGKGPPGAQSGRRHRPSRRQAGSATLVALALTVFLTFAGVMALDVGLLVVARARTQ